jgi:hypothetical protein
VRTSSLETAQELWDRLIDGEVLQPGLYDQDLVDGLQAELRIRGDLRSGLAEMSAQSLIEAIFKVLAPVAEMVTDLLRLYEVISAKRASDPNLRMRFNFDPQEQPLGLDLAAFREWEATLRRKLVTRRFWSWKQQPAWELVETIDGALAQYEQSDGVRPRAEQSQTWPDAGETAPVSGVEELDRRIAAVWDARETFVVEMSKQWPAREDYRLAFGATDGSLDEAVLMVSDFWDHSLAKALRQLAIRGSIARRDLGAEELSTTIATLVDEIDASLDSLPSVERQIDEAVTELESLLSLPMWGKRHELYAAWVCTQIAEAIGHARLSFAVESGYFSFDFRGARLATLDSERGVVELWTELRTAYDRPVGHGRTRGIQPDYRLVTEPAEDPQSTLLAVEVKQYARSFLRNAADALADYTGGLPEAHVVLAAHGPVSSKVLDGLTPNARLRAHVVRHMHPGNKTEIGAFRDLVARHVPPPPSPIAHLIPAQPAKVLDRDGDVRVTLYWDGQGVDLDLHAKLVDGQTVSFSGLRAATPDGAVWLEGDVQDAPGPEVLRISGTDRVVVAVHSYTDRPIASVGARLRVQAGSNELTMTLGPTPRGKDSRWFRALVVFPDRIETIEEFTDGPALD